ncbi:MAG: hypothetical protein LBI06_00200, partial [Treponema sp.]|nr:hypothetical protein [Treponema sp.]
ENEMPNIAFKRELLKIQIEKMAHNDNISAARFTMPSNTYSVQDYIRIRNSYLSGILPFIKYDY